MKKSKIKKMALSCINKLEYCCTDGSSISTCSRMPLDYGEFLVKKKILKHSIHSIKYVHFFDETRIEANLFRMMVITEYCKQKGIEI